MKGMRKQQDPGVLCSPTILPFINNQKSTGTAVLSWNDVPVLFLYLKYSCFLFTSSFLQRAVHA